VIPPRQEGTGGGGSYRAGPWRILEKFLAQRFALIFFTAVAQEAGQLSILKLTKTKAIG
jgi:hypothetical protein